MKILIPVALAIVLSLVVAAHSDAQRRLGVPVDTCDTAFNGICEEPRADEEAMCLLRTDRADCVGRRRSINDAGVFFGRDDRILMDTGVFPWSAIGLLSTQGGRCTGTLVAPDVVLTAAHCLVGRRGIAQEGTFITAQSHLRGPFTAQMIDSRILPTLRTDSDMDASLRENVDWALVRLDRPIGAELGYLDVELVRDNRPIRRDLISAIAMLIITAVAAASTQGRTRVVLAGLAVIGGLVLIVFSYRTLLGEDPRQEPLWQAGYSWDTGNNLSGSEECELRGFTETGLIAHACDTVDGDSGSPLLVRRGEGWAIIGVVSYTSKSWHMNAPGRLRGEAAYAVSASSFPDPQSAFESR